MRYSSITMFSASKFSSDVIASGSYLFLYNSVDVDSAKGKMNKVGSVNGIDFYHKQGLHLVALIPETHPLYNISVIREALCPGTGFMDMVKDVYIKDAAKLFNE